ncbi:unnamed protein product [Parascedosporium putredinis]|uniref:Xylanolytic transcriptional activator regulatory domain-containing protein n=1 Tax=Parascedosporium putredinis TaxID=1442378 RepID=A0A9P1MBZ7_9PEZI|nr:unnamed protein product [Parascedosporium putredinis]CAI7996751.1 unnamed protein product [Parascedosporium putredinis]
MSHLRRTTRSTTVSAAPDSTGHNAEPRIVTDPSHRMSESESHLPRVSSAVRIFQAKHLTQEYPAFGEQLLPQLSPASPNLRTPTAWASDIVPDIQRAQEPSHFLTSHLLPDIITPDAILEACTNPDYELHAPRLEARSILSRPTSPSRDAHSINSGFSPQSASALEITDEHHKYMQARISEVSDFVLPSRHAMAGYVNRYFNNFNKHQPLLHGHTWSPSEAPVPLVLAVCANGSAYSLEHAEAVEFYRHAVKLLAPADSGLWVLQTMMLVAAFAAWSGNLEDLQTALQLQEDDAGASQGVEFAKGSCVCRDLGDGWRKKFERDIPSSVSLEPIHGLLPREAVGRLHRAGMAPSHANPLASHVAIRARRRRQALRPDATRARQHRHVWLPRRHLLHPAKIIFFRKAQSATTNASLDDSRRGFIQALRRWQIMWENEPESSLSPDHPEGPILFNSTAMLRLAYVRLVADYAPLRNAFSFSSPDADFPLESRIPERLPRSAETARAALQAVLALNVPARLGFRVVSRTSFWVWSVQHALSYFECALLLSQWLQSVEHAEAGLSEEEMGIRRMVEEILQFSKPRLVASSGQQDTAGELPLSVAVLLLWAELLDTGDTTVWKIMPIMSKVLENYANMLLSGRDNKR